MKKKIILCLIAAVAIWTSTAEAPVLKNIFPQNYARITRLSETESDAVIAGAGEILGKQLKKDSVSDDYSFISVYIQNEGTRHFYRVCYTRKKIEHIGEVPFEESLVDEDELYWTKSGLHSIYQIIMEKSAGRFTVLGGGWYGKWIEDNSGVRMLYTDFLLVPSDERIGFMKAQIEVPLSLGQTRDSLIRISIRHRGGRAYGVQSAFYQLLAPGATNPFGEGTSYLEIHASDCLVDTKSPLLYSILSGFDKNTATCCKENSSDNMMVIRTDFHMTRDYIRKNGNLKLQQAAIINGDASSKASYFKTDRIETLTVEAWDPADPEVKKETFSFTLNDYCLNSQTIYLPFESGKYSFLFNTSAVIRAEKEDVCFSEFNLKLGSSGWIFGKLM